MWEEGHREVPPYPDYGTMKRITTVLLLFLGAMGAYSSDTIEGNYESFSPVGMGLYPITKLSLSNGKYTHYIKSGYICEGKWKSNKHCKPPYSYPVTGYYTVAGNKVTFDSIYMEEKVYYLIAIRKWQALLSKSEYEIFNIGQRIPDKFLVRVNP